MSSTRMYCDGRCVDSDFDPATIPARLEDPAATVWLDLEQPSADDLQVISKAFGLSPLAIEDATTAHQRPKLDHYDGYSFLNLYTLELDHDGGLVRHELSAFVSGRYLVTIRKDKQIPVAGITQRWDDNVELAGSGASFLLWGLLDVVVDGYFDLIQGLDDTLDDLEDDLFADGGPSADNDLQRRTFLLRKALTQLRRVVLPMRDVLGSLTRVESTVVDHRMMPYFRDVQDHLLRVWEWGDSLRDQASAVDDTRLALQSNRMNEVMKKLTSWAAIIAVPAVITGYYGMNVRIFPTAGTVDGGILALGLIGVIVVGLYVGFRRRNWL